jgi:hypothetical protein
VRLRCAEDGKDEYQIFGALAAQRSGIDLWGLWGVVSCRKESTGRSERPLLSSSFEKIFRRWVAG